MSEEVGALVFVNVMNWPVLLSASKRSSCEVTFVANKTQATVIVSVYTQ